MQGATDRVRAQVCSLLLVRATTHTWHRHAWLPPSARIHTMGIAAMFLPQIYDWSCAPSLSVTVSQSPEGWCSSDNSANDLRSEVLCSADAKTAPSTLPKSKKVLGRPRSASRASFPSSTQNSRHRWLLCRMIDCDQGWPRFEQIYLALFGCECTSLHLTQCLAIRGVALQEGMTRRRPAIG